jgi:hypothetical protein
MEDLAAQTNLTGTATDVTVPYRQLPRLQISASSVDDLDVLAGRIEIKAIGIQNAGNQDFLNALLLLAQEARNRTDINRQDATHVLCQLEDALDGRRDETVETSIRGLSLDPIPASVIAVLVDLLLRARSHRDATS